MASSYDRPIIIKKVKKHAHAHHGGAWKIAYADFVTAMMAFFLLLWLISMTTPEQKKGLADYFAPASLSETTSGAGGVLAGNAFDDKGAKTSNSSTDKNPGLAQTRTEGLATLDDGSGEMGMASGNEPTKNALQQTIESDYRGAFEGAAASIRQAWQESPNLTDIQDRLRIEETREGLEIQIIDDAVKPMFAEGSKYPFEQTRAAIAAIAPVLEKLPNQIRISGHTAAGSTYEDPRYGAWELSSDRANVVRAILSEFGLSDEHVQSVVGRAASEPLLPNDPYLSANQRIEITLLQGAPPVPPNLSP
ncbi:MAG TPA: flagellar motor protein MotB [Devosia sp.]|nr:flagellar motor protein MotB [Devosia sp.]